MAPPLSDLATRRVTDLDGADNKQLFYGKKFARLYWEGGHSVTCRTSSLLSTVDPARPNTDDVTGRQCCLRRQRPARTR